MTKQKENIETEQQKGLYLPSFEKDSCGVGMLADLSGIPSRYTVDAALTFLENMEHRGACGCEENTGDGAGILSQIPHDFFKTYFDKKDTFLPKKGKYGVGMFFIPKEEKDSEFCIKIIEKHAQRADFQIIGSRLVPVNNSMIGDSALSSEPNTYQFFFKTSGFNHKSLERRFYFLRKRISKEVYETRSELIDSFYICSLSSKTLVYKGMLTATQLRPYFLDLQDENFSSAVSIVHSRFSTNTIPKWKLAQPFRCIAHNGEINSIRGNINWWKARENYIKKVEKDRPDLISVLPICGPNVSDSGNFDNVVDFLMTASRSIPHSIMMLIPEAWQNNKEMPDYKKAFYEYHDAVLEPWDGPAAICFTDGTILGATLDRNGLRPSRYVITDDNFLILGSEVGCLPIPPEKIVKKGRLEPGKMLLADLDENRIVSDKEVKETICNRKPYRKWLDQNAIHITQIAKEEIRNPRSIYSLKQRQLAFGFTLEDKELIVNSMIENKKEAIGSMGADVPLAVLSKIAQHPANYFKQQFAQVTNPPIDPLREKFYMSLSTVIGGGSKIVGIAQEEAKVIRLDSPILSLAALEALSKFESKLFYPTRISTTFDPNLKLAFAIDYFCEMAMDRIKDGKNVIIISDRTISPNDINIPSLLAIGALHHLLIEKGMRKEVTLIVDAGDIWETHHCAALLSFGADLICPYLALETCQSQAAKQGLTKNEAQNNYLGAVNKGLLKIMSKQGVSTIASYKGSQTFEALGISKEVTQKCFKGVTTRLEGMTFEGLQKENKAKHKLAFSPSPGSLPDLGNYQWKQRGEYHLFNPKTIHLLQHSTKTNDYPLYKKFAAEIDTLESNASTLRSFLRIKKGASIPIEEVESKESILKRFATGAMSFGSISYEAHTTLAKAMNRIGGKSNSGEGGEDPARFEKLANGDWERSAIKQVASGRFGVDINYLTNAIELQIKMAQGAKPGEGGQLPGHKVDENIAKVRNSTPGVGLISPPPHHDIYSIEDLAQLIYDLKNANRAARISVKLVSNTGVGVIASGVAKAHADHILISGADGGTGASPLSSLRHAGLPWEIGLSETHQTLVKNGLRDRVVIQTDGQIRSGRDLAVATLLGAEEWGIATAALVVEGCILMRKCHLNTCPVGIATQDKSLRKKFTGKVDEVVNYFHFLAEHFREIMAECGFRTVNEMVGRTDLLSIERLDQHWKTKGLDLSPLLFKQANPYQTDAYNTKQQNHGLEDIIDHQLIALSDVAREDDRAYQSTFNIKSTDRTVGTMLSNEIAKKYGKAGMEEASLTFRFSGAAGQSFGAFGAKGLFFTLLGEANDYFGKGLSGARLAVKPDPKAIIAAEENVIIGNVALYGATAGEAFINGIAGDRFCVRNSGAHAVVEGIGHNGCEYMTGGIALILGKIGRNFGAGMSGGLAFIFDPKKEQSFLINDEMVFLETPDVKDLLSIRELLRKHYLYTGSPKAYRLLNEWEEASKQFLKVFPKEYKKVLESQKNVSKNYRKAI